jgi:hypothetical protein
MRRLFITTVPVILLVGAVVVAVGQAPTPPAESAAPSSPQSSPQSLPVGLPSSPPKVLPGMATTPLPPSVPPTPGDPPLSRFEPLASFPVHTQNAVRGVVLGAAWMTRMHQPHGRFLYGYNPALRQPLAGDHDLKQARGALALAQAAKFTGDEKQATLAAQSVLALLAATRADPADPNVRVPVHSYLTCNRVGFAALVALAIYELPGADEKLLAEAERLCAFLRKNCRPDGSVHYTDGASEDPVKVEPAGRNEYPGLALHALAVGNRLRPAAWKVDCVRKGLGHYRAVFRDQPHPLLAATLTPAFAELYQQTPTPEAAAAVFEMNDWLCGLQIAGNDPRTPHWAGAFRSVVDGRPGDTPPGPETGLYVASLAAACQLTRLVPDLDRHTKYKSALADAIHFLSGLQYLETTTRHFEATFRASMLVGGFHLTPEDGNLRIDGTANAVSGLVRFLGCGAER